MDNQEFLLLKQEFELYKNQTDNTINAIKQDITSLDKRVKDMEMTKQKTEYQYEQIMQSLKTLNEQTIPNLTAQIEELKNKPVKRYDQAVTAIIGAVFGAIGAGIANVLMNFSKGG